MTERSRPINTRACFTAHMGPWAILPGVLEGALAAIRTGQNIAPPMDHTPFAASDEQPGVALISLEGPGMKLRSKYGGYSTNEATLLTRELTTRKDIHTICYAIDSPGGQVHGGFQLSDAIYEARRKKTIHAHIVNVGASLAFLLASQADRITCDESAQVGGLGVFTLLHDFSGAAAAEGVKVHLVTTGGIKGQGSPGTEVTPAVLAEAQRIVDSYGDLFVRHVARGRGMNDDDARALFTGEVWNPRDARKRGLVDGTSSLPRVLADLGKGKAP